MANEEIKKIITRADDEYDMLKDKIHEQYDEIKRLNNIIKEARKYVIEEMYTEPKELYGLVSADELLEILDKG